MKLLVSLDQRFSRTPDGAVWTDGQCAYRFWLRYLEVFDEVRVVARVRETAEADPAWIRADGPQVSFAAIPMYVGVAEYVRQSNKIRQAVLNAMCHDSAVMLRASAQISNLLYPLLRRTRRPYGVEVVNDPYDVFAPNVFRHRMRPLLRHVLTKRLKRQCHYAATAAYVTREYLQRRYPPNRNAFATHYSSVELPPAAFASTPVVANQTGKLSLITVASLNQRIKGIDYLIDAVAQVVERGVNIELSIAGDGQFRCEFESQARTLGRLGKEIHFLGQLPGSEAVREALKMADMFVLPSLSEGLPRALIEAMACGLPCIGSSVAGIPELLPPECLVPAADSTALADKIHDIAADRQRMSRMAAENLERATEFNESEIHARRLAHYQALNQVTRDWLSLRSPARAMMQEQT